MVEINLDEYNKIKLEYLSNCNKDVDVFTAYNLMIRASGQMEYIDSMVAEYEALTNELDFMYDKVLATISLDLTNDKKAKSIADASRQAITHETAEEAKITQIKAKKVTDTLKACSKFLGRVYFDCKSIWQVAEPKRTGDK